MPLLLFALFVAVPLIEIALFIQIGGVIGLVPTLVIVVGTALAGSYLLRQQGLRVFSDAQQRIQRGELPVDEMLHGVFLAAAGVLLLTPGFLTDTLGLLLFVPPARQWIAGRIVRWVRANMVVVTPEGTFRPGQPGEPPDFAERNGRGPVIDAPGWTDETPRH